MSRPLRLLAVDLGAESGRAVLGLLDGGRLQIQELHRFPNSPVKLGETLHWDFLRLFQEVVSSLRAAGRLDSVGVDAWGVDFGLLDERGRLVANPVHYRDRRTEGMVGEAFCRVPKEEIYAATGIQFLPINSLYQLLSMVVSQDPQLELARTFLTVPDLVDHFLVGCSVCEFTNATTTQCYDPRAGDWAKDLLERLGIPSCLFPPVVPPGTLLGHLRGELAEEVGPVAVVAPASHDTGSAVVAVPFMPGRPAAFISSGTWCLVGLEVDEPVISPAAMAANLTNEGGVGGSFRLLRNVMGLWLLQECRRAWARSGEDLTYEQLTELAHAAPPLTAFVDPDDERFLRPGDMPGFVQDYCRRTAQPVPSAPGEVARVVLESLALKQAWVLERLEEVSGRRLEVVHMVGGGCRNRLLCQLTADAAGRPLLAGPVEATALGNLVVQAMSLKELASLAQGRELIAGSFPIQLFEPHSDWSEPRARFATLLGRP